MLQAVFDLQPRSVLDVGCGYGKWGFLVREMLDWNPGRLDRATWEIRIDGVEVFSYESPLHDWVYDSIQRADILDIGSEVTGYDLIIMSDVIEHLPKDRALELLDLMLISNRNILVSTPVEFFEQEVVDNPHEHHVSHWKAADFERFNHDLDIAGGAAIVVLLAGAGATSPDGWDRWTNIVMNHLPVVSKRGMVRRLAKRSLDVVRGEVVPGEVGEGGDG